MIERTEDETCELTSKKSVNSMNNLLKMYEYSKKITTKTK